jgi:hypothetical protein
MVANEFYPTTTEVAGIVNEEDALLGLLEHGWSSNWNES